MNELIKRFHRSRRGAVAMIFAGSLLPLTWLVGLSIDYSFYAQARAQFSLAGDAAATYAIREATATYALESEADATNPAAYPNVTTDSISAGNTAGYNWFSTQLATLPTSYLSSATGNPNVSVSATACTGVGGGFNVTVNYTGVYPPFFDLLFKSSKQWYIVGSSKACSTYTYTEVLLMLDTSGSMLLAADPSGITTLDDNTACIETYPTAQIGLPVGGFPTGNVGALNGTFKAPGQNYYGSDPADAVTWSNVSNYVGSTSSGSCKTGNTIKIGTTTYPIYYNAVDSQTQSGPSVANPGANGSSPFAPCAFACHTTTAQAADGYTLDYYGVARRLGVSLRIDAVFAATENVIEDMQKSEQVSNEYTAGVYQFNDNASSIVNGTTTGTTPDPSQEATENLDAALTAVEADDWTKTSTETAVPIVSTVGSTDPNEDYTDFGTSMSELYSGGLTSGAAGSSATNAYQLPALTAGAAAGAPTSISNPAKVLIIVTDGLDDTNPASAAGRQQGPMTQITGAAGELTANSGATCKKFKSLNFTIYVLYIDYVPAPVPTFYWPYYASQSTPYVSNDYGNALAHTNNTSTGGSIENWVLGNAANNLYQNNVYPSASVPNAAFSTAPDQAALQACAGTSSSSASNYTKYYYEASSTSQINTAMTSILASALTGAIRISQ